MEHRGLRLSVGHATAAIEGCLFFCFLGSLSLVPWGGLRTPVGQGCKGGRVRHKVAWAMVLFIQNKKVARYHRVLPGTTYNHAVPTTMRSSDDAT